MISNLVTLISLNLTLSLIQNYSIVAGSLPVTNATATTPIQVTSTGHGIPPGRVLHGILFGVTGETEANGLWVFTVVDADTFSLSTLDAQGNIVQSVGTNAYVSGGTIQYAFPDYGILLGRRLANLSSAPATPRITMIPTLAREWTFDPYGGQGGAPLNEPGDAEQRSQLLQAQIMTEPVTFEVTVSGCASPPSPDALDFDATRLLYQALLVYLFDAVGGRVRVLRSTWTSQGAGENVAAMMQRGQQWSAIIELQMPIVRPTQQLAPAGTTFVFTVEPTNPQVPTDVTTITVAP